MEVEREEYLEEKQHRPKPEVLYHRPRAHLQHKSQVAAQASQVRMEVKVDVRVRVKVRGCECWCGWCCLERG